jgi:hypothetical protein
MEGALSIVTLGFFDLAVLWKHDVLRCRSVVLHTISSTFQTLPADNLALLLSGIVKGPNVFRVTSNLYNDQLVSIHTKSVLYAVYSLLAFRHAGWSNHSFPTMKRRLSEQMSIVYQLAS